MPYFHQHCHIDQSRSPTLQYSSAPGSDACQLYVSTIYDRPIMLDTSKKRELRKYCSRSVDSEIPAARHARSVSGDATAFSSYCLMLLLMMFSRTMAAETAETKQRLPRIIDPLAR
jgi:hypothetical protein